MLGVHHLLPKVLTPRERLVGKQLKSDEAKPIR